jgi:hypothetical protein
MTVTPPFLFLSATNRMQHYKKVVLLLKYVLSSRKGVYIVTLYDRMEIKLCIPPLRRTKLKLGSTKGTERNMYSSKHDP